MEPLFDKLARQRKLRRLIAGVVKFVVVMIGMTIICGIAWEYFLDGKVYSCTDNGGFDYLSPGDWVHSHNGYPVVVVPQIVPPHDMSDPDTIKARWSIAKLWCVWILFFGVSLLVSFGFARVQWMATLERLGKERGQDNLPKA